MKISLLFRSALFVALFLGCKPVQKTPQKEINIDWLNDYPVSTLCGTVCPPGFLIINREFTPSCKGNGTAVNSLRLIDISKAQPGARVVVCAQDVPAGWHQVASANCKDCCGGSKDEKEQNVITLVKE